MAAASWLIWGVSLGLLLLLLSLDFRANREALGKKEGVLLAVVLLALLVLFFANQEAAEAMGAEDNPVPWDMLGLLYVAMLFGVLSHHVFESGDGRAFCWKGFLKPLFASPLIFLPLASGYQSELHDLQRFTMADLMIVLAAFQNGFFWRVVFDKQKKGQA